MIHDHAFAFQHHADPPITKSTTLAGICLHFFANFRIVGRTLTPDGLGIDTNKPTHSALRDIMVPHRL
jgi:hypothetical protein